MNNFIFRMFLSTICLMSIFVTISSNVIAAPVKLNQVVQVVNTKPGKAATGSFSQLRLSDEQTADGDGDEDKKGDGKTDKTGTPAQQDERVITTTTTEVVEDEECDCAVVPVPKGGFPKWALLGLAAVPLVFLIRHHDKDTPTPTPPDNTTPTPTTPTTPTDTPTPPTTPTPPEPVPEPMTILLFGTGLAGIGVAARKRFGKKDKKEEE